MFKNISWNWKTSTAGVTALLTIILGMLSAVFDGDPATVVNWTIVVPGILSAIGLIFGKDGTNTGQPK